jgi:hypothetical protein
MALAVDATSNSGAKLAQTSYSVTHVIGTGANRLLIVCVGHADTTSVSSVTYNSVAMTSLVSEASGNTAKVRIYYLVEPDTGSHSITVTFSGETARSGIGAISFTGADQNNPINTYGSADGTELVVPRVTLTTTVKDTYLIDSLYHGQDSSVRGTGQTSIYRATPDGQDTVGASYKALANAGSGTMYWTVSDESAIAVCAVQEVQMSPKVSFIA